MFAHENHLQKGAAMTYDDLKQATDSMQEIFYQSKRLVKSALQLSSGQLQNFDVDAYILNKMKRELKNWDSVKCRWKTPR